MSDIYYLALWFELICNGNKIVQNFAFCVELFCHMSPEESRGATSAITENCHFEFKLNASNCCQQGVARNMEATFPFAPP